jgi:hypothetical protein
MRQVIISLTTLFIEPALRNSVFRSTPVAIVSFTKDCQLSQKFTDFLTQDEVKRIYSDYGWIHPMNEQRFARHSLIPPGRRGVFEAPHHASQLGRYGTHGADRESQKASRVRGAFRISDFASR